MNKGHVSQEMFAGRISAKGKITSLTTGFSLAGNKPFSLFIIPKSTGSYANANTAIVDCKLYQEAESSDCPFTTNCWDAPAVIEIAINGIDLDEYDVYWGSGMEAEAAS